MCQPENVSARQDRATRMTPERSLSIWMKVLGGFLPDMLSASVEVLVFPYSMRR